MGKQPTQAAPQAGGAKKKKKIQVDVTGKAFIKATFNNVIVTITDVYGNVISWSSAGRNGFKVPLNKELRWDTKDLVDEPGRYAMTLRCEGRGGAGGTLTSWRGRSR